MTDIFKSSRSSAKFKSMGDREKFLSRITKSLYYSQLPLTDRLSLPVAELAAELFTEVRGGRSLERLDVEEAGRISRDVCASPCSLVLALLYLDRLKDCNPEYLQRVALPELFLVSLMVASKFLNDDGEDDQVYMWEWAAAGDLTVSETNRLEKEFLGAIDWAIFVQERDFWERLEKLEQIIAYKEGQKRGWFSYTELSCLMDNVPLAALIHAFVSFSSICMATYAAGVMTLLGSVLVASQLPGTSLAPPRQPAAKTEAMNFTNSRLTGETENEDILENAQIPAEFYSRNFDFSNGNDSCTNCLMTRTKRRNQAELYGHWECWLRTMMNWLENTNYSKLIDRNSGDESALENTRIIDKIVDDRNSLHIGAFITNSEFADENFRRETENLIMGINLKETLYSNYI